MMLSVLRSSSTASPRAFDLALRLVLQAITPFEIPYVHAVVFVFTLFTFHIHTPFVDYPINLNCPPLWADLIILHRR